MPESVFQAGKPTFSGRQFSGEVLRAMKPSLERGMRGSIMVSLHNLQNLGIVCRVNGALILVEGYRRTFGLIEDAGLGNRQISMALSHLIDIKTRRPELRGEVELSIFKGRASISENEVEKAVVVAKEIGEEAGKGEGIGPMRLAGSAQPRVVYRGSGIEDEINRLLEECKALKSKSSKTLNDLLTLAQKNERLAELALQIGKIGGGAMALSIAGTSRIEAGQELIRQGKMNEGVGQILAGSGRKKEAAIMFEKHTDMQRVADEISFAGQAEMFAADALFKIGRRDEGERMMLGGIRLKNRAVEVYEGLSRRQQKAYELRHVGRGMIALGYILGEVGYILWGVWKRLEAYQLFDSCGVVREKAFEADYIGESLFDTGEIVKNTELMLVGAEYNRHAAGLFESIGKRREMAISLNYLGRALIMAGRMLQDEELIIRGIEARTQALGIFEGLRERMEYARGLSFRGSAYIDLANIRRKGGNMERAQEAARLAAVDKRKSAHLTLEMGDIKRGKATLFSVAQTMRRFRLVELAGQIMAELESLPRES